MKRAVVTMSKADYDVPMQDLTVPLSRFPFAAPKRIPHLDLK